MPTAKPDFSEWAFEQSGRNPLAWWHSAHDLLDGADAVKQKVQNLGAGMHSLAAVQAMLIGLAIECLLKGMWIKRHQAWIEKNQEYALTKNGQYVGIPALASTNLSNSLTLRT